MQEIASWSYNDEKKLAKMRRRILRWADALERRRDVDIDSDIPEINEGETRSFKVMLDLYKAMAREAADATGQRVTVMNLSDVSTEDLRKMAATKYKKNEPDAE